MQSTRAIGICAVLLALVGTATGCSKSSSASPTSPDPPASLDLSGRWHGTIQDNKNGSGTLDVTVKQSGSNVSADAVWTPVSGGVPGQGAWQGALSGNKIAFSFRTV